VSAERFRIEHGAIPEPVRRVCSTLHRAGFGAWIVGGCVRDLLLGRAVSDWDVCTSAKPEQVQALFRKVIPTGIQHGTVTVVLDGVHYEVTTLRGEGAYSDGRRPDSVFYVDDVREDLARRDFTVNAIAYDVTKDEFIDPFDGRDDLRAKVVRAVGDGNERFREDGLRVLRAARFSATLEFALDEATKAAIAPNLPTFRKVSRERVRDEWLKTMKARRPSRAFVVMLETGILGVVSAELERTARIEAPQFKGTLFDWHLATMDEIEPGDAILRLAALFLSSEQKAIEAFAKENKFSTDERTRLVHLTRCARSLPERADATDAELRRWLRDATRGAVSEIALLAKAAARASSDSSRSAVLDALFERVDEIIVRRDPIEPREIAVNGDVLQRELGMAPSKQMGQLLAWALDRVLEDPSLNSRETLVAMIQARAAGA
jgi:tRNA nucleotidyltransferase (CCA-adding enzyme)